MPKTKAQKKVQKNRKLLSEDRENPKTPGTTFKKKIEQGPNKGDIVVFRVAPSGKPYPIRVIKDVGGDSTLRDNSIPFGKKS